MRSPTKGVDFNTACAPRSTPLSVTLVKAGGEEVNGMMDDYILGIISTFTQAPPSPP